jgi:micrococcal nuclease
MLAGKEMIEPNYVSKAKVTRVIDGDTVVVTISPGFKLAHVDYKMRLHGIDTAEMNASDKSLRELAVKARMHVTNSILDREVLVKSVKNTLGADLIDSFGRWLAVIFYVNDAGEQVNLNEELLSLGLATVWTK